MGMGQQPPNPTLPDGDRWCSYQNYEYNNHTNEEEEPIQPISKEHVQN